MSEPRKHRTSGSDQLLWLAPIPVLLGLSILLAIWAAGSARPVWARPSFESPVSPVVSPVQPTPTPSAPPPPAEPKATVVEKGAPTPTPPARTKTPPPEKGSDKRTAPQALPGWDTAMTCLSGFSYLWLACGVLALCLVPLGFILLSVLGANVRANAREPDRD